jgi:chromosome segregation ATPase
MDQIITAGAGESSLPAAARAIQITERIRANGRTAVNAVCAIGEDLRTMKIDGLYTELGYENFEDYAEKEFDLKRRQAYQYISVYEKLGKEFVQSNAQLGITKLALLTTVNPEDRAEIMESEDVAKITTRELEELLDKYKQQGEQLSLLQEESKAETEKLQAKLAAEAARSAELEAKLSDIESAPVEVAVKEVQVPDKKTEKKLKDTEKKLKEKEKDLDDFQKVADERIRKAEKEKEALEAKVAELQKAVEKPPENADKSNFKVLLSTVYRDMLGLVEFINDTEDIADRKQYFKKALEILHVCEDSIKERVEIPTEILKQSLTSRGVVDIGSMKPISSSNAEYDDDDYDEEEEDDE